MALLASEIEAAEGPSRRTERDRYYMRIADVVQSGAKCTGTQVGAVITLQNRVVSTGYNGTPQGVANCGDGGCVRCSDSALSKEGRHEEMTDQNHVSGAALDRCICVHAEQNALLTAARFGIAVDGGSLYTTRSPCFGCLKEAVQAGIARIVYRELYEVDYSKELRAQYESLCQVLRQGGDASGFEQIGS